MKRKRRDAYPPLELLRRMTAEHPGIWDDMEMLHRENGTGGLPHWPEWCYAPTAQGSSAGEIVKPSGEPGGGRASAFEFCRLAQRKSVRFG